MIKTKDFKTKNEERSFLPQLGGYLTLQSESPEYFSQFFIRIIFLFCLNDIKWCCINIGNGVVLTLIMVLY